MTRGRLCGIAVGLCLGLALLIAPAALANPTLTGTVNAVASDGAGGYYAGGSFTVPSSTIVNAVHVKHDGTIDASWGPNPAGTVRALAVSGSSVYLGGSFTISSLHNAARVNATTGALDSTWNPDPDGAVNAIAVTADRAYLGGAFTQVSTGSGTASRGHAAAVDLTNGYDLGWDPSPDGPVNALAASPTAVYIGGAFSQVDTSTTPVVRSNAAAVDLYAGVDNGWDPDPSGGPVNALAISGSTVYLGGSFTTISGGAINTSPRLSGLSGSVNRPNAAAVSSGTGQDTGWKPAPNGPVNALAVSGGTVYLGGTFTQVNAGAASTAARTDAAAVDALTGYDTGWDAGVTGTVNGVATWNTDVYLGGTFGVASTIQAQHALSVVASPTGTGSGQVTSIPGGIDCPTSCSSSFNHGQVITLRATASSGSGFVGWSGGACSGTSNICNVSLDADTSVTATFNIQHTLGVTVAGGSGSVTSTPSGIGSCTSSCSAPFTDGTPVKLTATPASGFAFTGWTGGACFGNVTRACTFTMSSSAGPVTAHFIPTHDLTVNENGSSGSGSVTSNPAGLDCPAGACSHPFDDGADVVLTATPAPGSRFDHWAGVSCPGTGACDVNLTQDTTVTAVFVQQHMLIVARNGSGSGMVSGGLGAINCGSGCNHAYDLGTPVMLTATPAPGSRFSGWSGNGCAGTAGTCAVTLSSDIHVTATFTAQGTKPPPPPPPTTTTTPTKPPPPKTPAPKCSLKGGSSRVLLAAPRKGRPKVKPGTLSATVRCDRATTVTVSGVITELVGKKPKHGKQRTKSFKLRSLRVSMKAKGSKRLTFSLPRSALTDLKHRASMSVALTLTATGASSHVSATMARLTGY